MIPKCFSSVLELPTFHLVCPQRLAVEDLVTRVICPVLSALTLKSSADFTSESISSFILFFFSLSSSISSRTCFLFLCSSSVFFLSLWSYRCFSYFCRDEAAVARSFFVIGTLRTPPTAFRWSQMMRWATRECSCKFSTSIPLLTENPSPQIPDRVKAPAKFSLYQTMLHSYYQSCG